MKFPSNIQILTTPDEEDSFCGSATKTMIFFGSNYCHHCHDMVDFYSKLPQQYPSCKFAYVETSETKVDNIDGVPVFVIYYNGQGMDSVVGASPEKIHSILKKNF